MKLQIIPATIEDKPVIKNLGILYAYDMSKSCGFLPGWQLPETGIYAEGFTHLDNYWEEEGRYPFLIRINNELAGFVLVNKYGAHDKVDWNMAEFFIQGKFQGKGIASKVAYEIFQKFPGLWNVMVIPDNKPAHKFWSKALKGFTDLSESVQKIDAPLPHPMIVFEFHSANH
jgi:predicted acetyltransferase